MARRYATKQQRWMAYLVHEGKCGICGVILPPAFDIDHKQAWARGGKTDLVNLQPACPRCNRKKGTQ